MDSKLIWIIVVIAAAAAVYVFMREKINLRKAAGGEDKERLRKAVARALPGESGYQVAYGHFEKEVHYGRRTYVTYYSYALACDAGRIWVIPLSFDKELILPGEPILITEDILGVADVSIKKDREGRIRRVVCALYDKGGASLLDCVVEVNNTRKDSYHHVNIIQEEECARFGRLTGEIAARINRGNEELQAQVHARENSARKASVLGTFGIVFSIIFPPVGLVLSIMGLRHIQKSSRGKNALKASLILCRAALVLSIIFTFAEAAFLFMST